MGGTRWVQTCLVSRLSSLHNKLQGKLTTILSDSSLGQGFKVMGFFFCNQLWINFQLFSVQHYQQGPCLCIQSKCYLGDGNISAGTGWRLQPELGPGPSWASSILKRFIWMTRKYLTTDYCPPGPVPGHVLKLPSHQSASQSGPDKRSANWKWEMIANTEQGGRAVQGWGGTRYHHSILISLSLSVSLSSIQYLNIHTMN